MVQRNERVSFKGAHGMELAARLDFPEGPPAAYALFAHCFTCSKDIFAASRISEALTEQGIAVLRFDFTGLGSSEGEFANTNFSSNVGDLVAAADFLRQLHGAPKILVGHSLGGTAVLVAAGRIAEAAAVATINSPYDPAHVRHLLKESVPEIERAGEAEVVIADRTFRIQKHFLEDVDEQNMRQAIVGLGKALLIFHAPHDELVDVDNARLIFEAAHHPKSFVSLDDADHLLRRKADAVYVGVVLAAWASRYLNRRDQEG
jgi:putative redox protein